MTSGFFAPCFFPVYRSYIPLIIEQIKFFRVEDLLLGMSKLTEGYTQKEQRVSIFLLTMNKQRFY